MNKLLGWPTTHHYFSLKFQQYIIDLCCSLPDIPTEVIGLILTKIVELVFTLPFAACTSSNPIPQVLPRRPESSLNFAFEYIHEVTWFTGDEFL